MLRAMTCRLTPADDSPLMEHCLSRVDSPCTRACCMTYTGTVVAGNCAGLSLYSAEISCVQTAGESKKKRRRGQRAHRSAFLFTHRGYSGPSVLDLSHSITMALERGTAAPGERGETASLPSSALRMNHHVLLCMGPEGTFQLHCPFSCARIYQPNARSALWNT